MAVSVSLNFMPSFYHARLGIEYGEEYYFNPEHRIWIGREEQKLLYTLFKKYGVGSPESAPDCIIQIQAVDLIRGLAGSRWQFPRDAVLESLDTVWAGVDPDKIASLDPHDFAFHPIMDRIISQYRYMSEKYGNAADVFYMKTGDMMSIHSPYTTAHQLCGEDIFIYLASEPEKAQTIFTKIWDIYQAVYGRISDELKHKPEMLFIGDCSASLLSPEIYGKSVMPFNRSMLSGFQKAGYHSCGASNHILSHIADTGSFSMIQLGPGTDMTKAAEYMPDSLLQPLTDPVLMREGQPADVENWIRQTVRPALKGREMMICAWALDRDTPEKNVCAMYDTLISLGLYKESNTEAVQMNAQIK